ncbi:putative Rossmann fold enzyme [Caldisphaera lagunensis DSM 15908]|uniref:Putative Rossmann fold enzyme n=1 Tax=Caldisphaera lagunensis (strain DSM 15908 / JCM 11604 / ANMR 0165 / IC-154) TaxID=1056495 RepID=L0ACN4_CALLD|nr:Rossmann fold enzyme [Caldisphaera lagunensis]AFZ70907.1 putative Rossmann fold enzyme [Caldisphaera lagunensis DSM 15908]
MSEYLMRYSKELKDILNRIDKIINVYTDYVEPIFKYPRHKELESSMEILPRICNENFYINIINIFEKINNSNICIVGPGDINNNISNCKIFAGPEGGLINALKNNIKFLYITGDLDLSLKLLGEMEFLSEYVFLHVHGDNYTRIRNVYNMNYNIIYTTQVITPYCALPIGVFTDGDRAISLSMLFNAKTIEVYGFDFNNVKCYHKDYCFEEKIEKLNISKEIIKMVAKKLNYNINFYDGKIILINNN